MRWVRPPAGEMTLREITERGVGRDEETALGVLTRLGLPSIEAVPVFAGSDGFRLGSPAGVPFDATRLAATRDGIMAVLGASIRVSSPRAYRALAAESPPVAWSGSGWLSDRRVLAFELTDGHWTTDVGGVRFECDPDPSRSLGLVIGDPVA